jgi:hypothetical protein
MATRLTTRIDRSGTVRGSHLGLRSLAIAIFAILLAVAAAWHALVSVVAADAPDQALRIAPHNWLALTNKAAEILETGDAHQLPKVAAFARAALYAQALNPHALGASAYASSDQMVNARPLADLSERLSRRNFATQLWLIESDAQSGNIGGTLRHYDIALRTIADAPQVLIPTLLAAAGEAPVRSALVPYVRNGAPWLPKLIRAGLEDDGQLVTIAGLWRAAGVLPADPIYRDLQRDLLAKLAGIGRFDLVADLYQRLPGSNPAVLASVDVTPPDEGPTGFVQWQIVTGASSGGDIVRNGASYDIEIFNNADGDVVVARKILLLRPGFYSLTARINAQAGQKGNVRFQLRCPGVPGHPITQSAGASGVARMSFGVTADCAGQYLELVAGGTSDSLGFQARVSGITLHAS